MSRNGLKYPNFLIIGAARSGTTTLYKILRLHPEIYLPILDEEPKFFSREEEYLKGFGYYLNKYFRSIQNHRLVGEKSTEYMESPITAERIYKFNPDMKILCILRDPVERAISNYWWSVSNNFETRPVNNAIRSEYEGYLKNPKRVNKIDSVRPFAYIDRGLYYENLLPFYRLFPRSNIKCILFEEFINRKRVVIESIFSFLHVQLLNLAFDSVEIQRSAERRESLNPVLYKELTNFFYRRNKKLPEFIDIDINMYWYKKYNFSVRT